MRRLVVIKMVLVICLMGTLPLIKVEAKSSIYVELLGSGGLFPSLNYEYFIKDDLPIRIGGWRSVRSNRGKVNTTRVWDTIMEDISLAFPIITLSKLIGKGNHKLELGGGLTYVGFKFVQEASKAYPDLGVIPSVEIDRKLFLSGVVGYRYQLPFQSPILLKFNQSWEKVGFLFRFSYTPLISIYSVSLLPDGQDQGDDVVFLPIWFGLSLGITF